MENEKYEAEYHFEYRIERIFGSEGQYMVPRLYFERDYTRSDMPYSMFAVAEEWLNRQEELSEIQGNNDAAAVRQVLAGLPYDKVNIVFDIKGISCAALANPSSPEYKAAEIKHAVSFEKFYQANCRINIESNTSEDHSGSGVIDMVKEENIVARFFFVVNFAFRKHIDYKLEVSGDKLALEFTCKARPTGIAVVPVFNQERFPCLRSDMGVNRACEPFVLDFSSGHKFKYNVRLAGPAAERGNYFTVGFADMPGAVPANTSSRYYMLDCYANNTLPVSQPKLPRLTYACPFCHRPIDYSLRKDKCYRRGGVACHPEDVKKDAKKATPVIYTISQTKQRRCMYCSGDLREDNSFALNKNRLLPPSFMEHDTLKIAFTGSTRAGKTTYISRFFSIIGDQKISMPMTMTVNSMQRFGINVRSAPIMRVEKQVGSYRVSDKLWTAELPEYIDRSINLNPPHYPKQTPNGDYKEFPFIAEVNNRAYVSFYDIAGEDAQGTIQVRDIAGNDAIGIFCIVNGKTDMEGNQKVVDMLTAAGLPKDCPVAVIVTKMDTLEKEFDTNCRCLRSDYFGNGKYDGSTAEWEINCASEEIRSFLIQNAILPDFTGVFDNVKYFGVSSFNFLDSIHEKQEDINAPGMVKFNCSSKRMELPFLWMLRQFSLIR